MILETIFLHTLNDVSNEDFGAHDVTKLDTWVFDHVKVCAVEWLTCNTLDVGICLMCTGCLVPVPNVLETDLLIHASLFFLLG